VNVTNPSNRTALVAIDPGRNLGWCLMAFLHGAWTLAACGLVCSAARGLNEQAAETLTGAQGSILRALWAMGHHPGDRPLAVCELMEFRPDDVRSNAQDLIRVATIGAAVAGMVSLEARFATPQEWKGQVPKDVMGRRVLAILSPGELAIMRAGLMDHAPGLHHNTLDAIGIGLWATGRMERGGVRP